LCAADLEQLLFELSRPAEATATADGMQLPLYQGLLCELQCAGELAAQQQQELQQQGQQQQLASYVEAQVKDEATWQVWHACPGQHKQMCTCMLPNACCFLTLTLFACRLLLSGC
jgi:hypothetical protein